MAELTSHLPSRQDFTTAVGSTFNILAEGHDPVGLKLTECAVRTDTATQECYSLLFEFPEIVPPVQGVYQLQHETLGEFQLFLVPVKLDSGSVYFEAVINRLLTGSKQ